jgi:hypothetical protein
MNFPWGEAQIPQGAMYFSWESYVSNIFTITIEMCSILQLQYLNTFGPWRTFAN